MTLMQSGKDGVVVFKNRIYRIKRKWTVNPKISLGKQKRRKSLVPRRYYRLRGKSQKY